MAAAHSCGVGEVNITLAIVPGWVVVIAENVYLVRSQEISQADFDERNIFSSRPALALLDEVGEVADRRTSYRTAPPSCSH